MHPGEHDVAARDAASQATSHHIFIFRAIPYTGEAQLEEDPPIRCGAERNEKTT